MGSESDGQCGFGWCRDRDAPLEVLIEDLVACLIAAEVDRRSFPPIHGYGDQDWELAREMALGHNYIANEHEAEALVHLARAKAATLAGDPSFIRLVELLSPAILEAGGELSGADVQRILEGGTSNGAT